MQDRGGPCRTPISRRRFGALALAALPAIAACGVRAPERPAVAEPTGPQKVPYGGDPSQFGEYTAPTGTGVAKGLVVIVHGGYWRSQFGLDLGRPLAAALVSAGWAAWNVEYRRVGDGGGWTSTFDDVALAMDHVSQFASARIPADKIFALGHSAGGHLAAWLAARPGLPPGSPGANPQVTLNGVVSQAGVLDLASAVRLGDGAVVDLLGGTPQSAPDRYTIASPIQRVPLQVPTICVHGTADEVVPISQSESFVQRAKAAGDRSELVRVDGADHGALIDVRSPGWTASLAALDRLAA
ncbi:alpha/beta hydrolase family protein [Pseudonocardia endophytica]|nr:prolyl oligopeptidase family serine peptidase [Pseudonocardia endophytica]